MINGYLDSFHPSLESSPLVDGHDLMADALFWPAYLYSAGLYRTAPAAFATDPADLQPLFEVLTDTERWPVLTVPTRLDTRVCIVYRNFPDDAGLDYLLDRGPDRAFLDLAAIEGHFRGPGLSWAELVTASAQPDARLSSTQRFLLLLPMCGDADTPPDAIELVSAALAEVGAGERGRDLASELLDSPYFGTPQWTLADGLPACSGRHAYRRPDRMTAEDLAVIASALSDDPAGRAPS
jgi:hypothetical protein